MYTIVDVETTGGSPANERITEIAILVYDGEQVIDKFVSLINPGVNIPYYITRLTGISDAMVANAPKFQDIARKIIELTENRIFVAHNVEFDYNFLKFEFKRLAYDFKRKKLCTVRLSRKHIPGKSSYSLDNICNELGISLTNHHRAEADATATVRLFEYILNIDAQNKPIIAEIAKNLIPDLHPQFNKAILDSLPESTGVYYLNNSDNRLIYVGKSVGIRSRILSHLSNNDTPKAIEMKASITDIGYEVTGSELIALLLEADEIKKHKPIYNRALRRTGDLCGIFAYYDKNGYLCLKTGRCNPKTEPIISFSSYQAARDMLELWVEENNLCQKLSGLYDNTGACFYHLIKKCNGACIGAELPEVYNQRVEPLVNGYSFDHDNFFIIDTGRNPEEKAVVCIENGSYKGFGYIDTNNQVLTPESLRDCIKPYAENRDTRSIIRAYLRNNKVEKIIKY